MGKTEYAKFQFMILVLRAIGLIFARIVMDSPVTNPTEGAHLLHEIANHRDFIENLMKEE